MTGQIDQLREVSRVSDQAATEIQESVDTLYNKRISVDVKEFEQLKREFTYEMQQQVKKVKQPSKGLKWYVYVSNNPHFGFPHRIFHLRPPGMEK